MTASGKKLFLWIPVLVLFISATIYVFYYSHQRHQETIAWVAHTFEVIAENEKVLIQCLEFEANSRAFMITADTALLQRFNKSSDDAFHHLDRLARRTRYNLSQQKRIDSLRHHVNGKLKYSLESVKTRIGSGLPKSFDSVFSQHYMDEIRKISGEIEKAEYILLKKRQQAMIESNRTANIILWIALLLVALLGMVTLITLIVFYRQKRESKEAEKIVLENNRKTSRILESINDGFIAVDKNWCYTYMNKKAGEMTHRDPHLIIGKNVWDEFPDAVGSATFKAFKKAMEEQKTVTNIDYYEPLNLWQENQIYPTPEGLSIFIRDISERKISEKKMVESEQRFRLVVESAPNAMVLVNHEGKITLVNSQVERSFGYSRDELIGKNVEILIPGRFKEMHPHSRNMFFDSPKTRSMGAGRELFAMRKDGSEFPVEIGLNPIESPEGLLVLASVIDITERKRAEERFRLVVESAPNAMVLVNHEGIITLVNSQTEKLFGYDRNELINHTVEMLIPRRFKENHPHFRNMFFVTPKARSMGAGRDLFAARKDESEFPVEIGLNPIESPEGQLVLASIIDITERKMQEANRLKNDFLANMSHELRTPLNAVLGFSELLIDQKVGPLSVKQLDYMNDIHASGSHLLKLINNVLDLSKIEAGKTDLAVETFRIDEVIEGVVKNVNPIADKKNIMIEQLLAFDVKTVALDKSKFRQILYNLVSNAIKFSRDKVVVRIHTAAHKDDCFILTVADNGIGIAKEDLKKLFIPFVQLDAGLARQHEGTGLGLALTRNLVALHGGQITVKSILGNGSTFSVVLPVTYKEKKHGAN
jgi:PAS domain S-box-containing protein